MYLLGVPWNPLTVTTAAIILGVGIDYAVHIYERFREEVENGVDPEPALRSALVAKSRPGLGSGAITILGIGVLVVSQFPVLSNFGIASRSRWGWRSSPPSCCCRRPYFPSRAADCYPPVWTEGELTHSGDTRPS